MRLRFDVHTKVVCGCSCPSLAGTGTACRGPRNGYTREDDVARHDAAGGTQPPNRQLADRRAQSLRVPPQWVASALSLIVVCTARLASCSDAFFFHTSVETPNLLQFGRIDRSVELTARSRHFSCWPEANWCDLYAGR